MIRRPKRESYKDIPRHFYFQFFYSRLAYYLMFSEVTILLALTVFHTIFTGTLPQVSDRTPLLGRSATMSCTFSSFFIYQTRPHSQVRCNNVVHFCAFADLLSSSTVVHNVYNVHNVHNVVHFCACADFLSTYNCFPHAMQSSPVYFYLTCLKFHCMTSFFEKPLKLRNTSILDTFVLHGNAA